MTLGAIHAERVLSDMSSHIVAMTPKTEPATVWRDVGDEWHEGGEPRTFALELDVEKMVEGPLFGRGNTSYLIPAVIRVSYTGLPRLKRNAMMVNDKKDLLHLFRTKEGLAEGRIPPETRGFETKAFGGTKGPDQPTYVEHRIMVHFYGETTP